MKEGRQKKSTYCKILIADNSRKCKPFHNDRKHISGCLGVGERERRDRLQRDMRKTGGGNDDYVPYLNSSDVFMSVNISQNSSICTSYCMSIAPQKNQCQEVAEVGGGEKQNPGR